jgi:hypothetical protein
MAFIYEVLNKETGEEMASISHPYEREEAKESAENMAKKIKQNFGVECKIIEKIVKNI